MAEMSVTFRSIPGTQAAIGVAGTHTVVVDRPPGKAGGLGLGFNGGQLLAMAIGGCFCNDLHYVAAEMGIEIASVDVEVTAVFDGEPLLVSAVTVDVKVTPADPGADVAGLVARARATSTVSNSIARGVPVAFHGGD
ncbi:OsmC family protein [Phreatobacter cathodiphilus]|uniref:Oxidoreductase n=1 Tax=Phreatobacter cathodiphilus TaxID=1868589 RepID=A0A2S0NAE2_9HYPH|nr:OsmC family protein [Phreatobacter cathodiphilus]AVO45140.1 oxidoreductase [Phreatobacter cathodiphilus]